LRKYEKVCLLFRKCAKTWESWESVPKFEKLWESVLKFKMCAKTWEFMRKCAKTWESVPEPEKVWKCVENAYDNANCYFFCTNANYFWSAVQNSVAIC
jgi:hypothetical protein